MTNKDTQAPAPSAGWTPPSEADRPEGYECLVTLPVRWVRCFSGRGFVWEATDPRLRIEALAHGWAPPPTANVSEATGDE